MKNVVIVSLTILVGVLGLAACSSEQEPLPASAKFIATTRASQVEIHEPPAETADLGAKLYAASCLSCHGDRKGEGGTGLAPSHNETGHTWRFQIGEPVRGRNINPVTHTRMPRYTRGKIGVVLRDRGVFALPDGQEGSPEPTLQHVYLIRFTARELWGDGASAHDSLHIDMWEDYLEPA